MGNAVDVFKNIVDFRQFLENKEESLRAVVPVNLGITPEKIIKMAVIAATKTPALLQCTKLSVMQAIMTSAELGLDFSGTLGEGWIIPYGKEAVFLAGYRGLVSLAYRSGAVLDIEARVVYEGDEFVYELGLEPKLVHRPSMTRNSTEAEPVAFYAIANLTSGLKKFEVMTKQEVDAIKARSAAAKSKRQSPWDTDYTEMGRKTVVRRLLKWLPLSTDAKLSLAEATVQEDRAFGLPELNVIPTTIKDGRQSFAPKKSKPDAEIITSKESVKEPPQGTPEERAKLKAKAEKAKRELEKAVKKENQPAQSNESAVNQPPSPGLVKGPEPESKATGLAKDASGEPIDESLGL